LCLLLLSAVHAEGPEGSTTAIEGRLLDSAGEPLPSFRVVARDPDRADVFISQPSDAEGRYSIALPSGSSYLIVALIGPGGERVALPEPARLFAVGETLAKDLNAPFADPPDLRPGAASLGGDDRLILSFVEDPALVGRQHWEGQIDWAADNEYADLAVARLIAAFTFAGLPRVEIGVRAGFGRVDSSLSQRESGIVDTDIWAKMKLKRSSDGKWDSAVGALFRVPTGDYKKGLGTDAVQAEWFVAGSRVFPMVVLVGHVGVASSAAGRIGGVSLEGKVAGSAGLGLLMPLSQPVSLLFEATYDGARFEGTDDDSRLLAGFNWEVHWRGKLRGGLSTGLSDRAPDVQLLVSYAAAF
jgi:hypothetical protein